MICKLVITACKSLIKSGCHESRLSQLSKKTFCATMSTSAIDQLPSTSTATSSSTSVVEEGVTAEDITCGQDSSQKTAEEPGNYEVLIDSIEAALSKKFKSKAVLRPLCSVAVPNGSLLQVHGQQVPSYVATINSHYPGYIIVLDTACTRLARRFACGTGKLNSVHNS